MAELIPGASAIDHSRFFKLHRNTLETGEHDDHASPEPPEGNDDKGVEGRRVNQPGDGREPDPFEDRVDDPGIAIEDQAPDDRGGHHGHEVGGEEGGPEEIHRPEAAVQEEGEPQTPGYSEGHDDRSIKEAPSEAVPHVRVLEHRLVVGDPNPVPPWREPVEVSQADD